MRKHLVFLLLLGLLVEVKASPERVVAKQGVLDLRNTDLTKGVSLDGEWEFYWQQLLPTVGDEQGQYVQFPSLWNGQEVNGARLGGLGYATYRLKILLPPLNEPLRIDMPEVYTAYELYLNGSLMLTNGKVSDSPNNFEPQWLNKAYMIVQKLDTAELTLLIANFVHSKGGINESIKLGGLKQLNLDRRIVEAVDMFLTGCLFMGGLFFLGLYLLGNRDKAILLFSLYSIVYSYRIMGIENYTLNNLIPDVSWFTLVYFEYLSLFISVGIFALYTKFLYPEDVNIWIIRIIYGICFLFGLITILFPPYYFTQLINPFLAVTIICILYALYVYMLAYKSKRLGSKYALVSTLALMLLFVLSILDYWAIWATPIPLTFWGYISFFFLQSLILSQRVSFQLRESKKQAEQGLQAKSEFLSNMSHEIRTPLNSVIGMSHILLKNNPRPDQGEQLDTLLFSANNLLTIVNDILDYNKLEAGKVVFNKNEIDVAEIARNIVVGLQNFAQEKNVKINLNIDPELRHKVLGDQTRFFQVLNNLVHNAVKFTPEGSVDVTLQVVSQKENSLALKVAVKDTGIGISKENMAIIFNRFTQADSSTSRSFGGTGLGLAISKKILELQGVDLQVCSEVNVGSTFSFVQHFEKSEGKIEIKNYCSLSAENEIPFVGKSILLVEDNSINVMVARSFLEKWGAQIDVAENGNEAISIFEKEKDKYNLILMDLHMPVMDGYMAAKIIRESGVTIPIIALTANLREDVELKINKDHFNDLIVKPFLPDELFQKVSLYIYH